MDRNDDNDIENATTRDDDDWVLLGALCSFDHPTINVIPIQLTTRRRARLMDLPWWGACGCRPGAHARLVREARVWARWFRHTTALRGCNE